MLVGWKYPQGWNKVLQKAVYALNQHSLYGAASLLVKNHGSRNQGVEMGVVVFTSTPSNPLAKFLLSVPMALCSAGLEIFAPKGRIISTRPYSNDSIELKVKTAAWPL